MRHDRDDAPSAAQVRRAVDAFAPAVRRRSPQIMLQEGLERMGLTSSQAAVRWMTNERTVRRWLDGTLPIPGTVWRLLELEPRAERLDI